MLNSLMHKYIIDLSNIQFVSVTFIIFMLDSSTHIVPFYVYNAIDPGLSNTYDKFFLYILYLVLFIDPSTIKDMQSPFRPG